MAPSFSASELAAWGGLLRVHALLDQAIDADLREHDGLRHVEFEVLLRLCVAPGQRMRIQELADASLLSRSGTSRLVDRLVSAGLVVREAATEDGRGAYAALTDAGRDTFERIRPRHIALVRERFLDRLTPEQIAVLGRIWRKVDPPQGRREDEPTSS